MQFYQNNINDVYKQLNVLPDVGLTDIEYAERLKKYGYNRIRRTNRRNIAKMFLGQFKNLLAIMLIAAAGFSFFLDSYRDAIILLIVVLFNAFVGFYQDWKSENILASIKDLVIDRCYVLRNSLKVEIPSTELVPGDIVFLDEGDGVPADIRLISATGIFTNDFIITGESQPKEKNHSFVTQDVLSISEQDNSVFMGTTIAKGEARGVVVSTGMNTELGKIAGKSEDIKESVTPLQKELNLVAKRITYISFALAVMLLGIKLLAGDTLNNALVFTIGIAAAMVPEGLPAQVSVSLALGVAALARKKAIVKRLSSVEALGAATVIASDKTGTITKNEMTIIHCYFNGENYSVTGIGYEPNGEILNFENEKLTQENLEDLKLFVLGGFLSSTGRINPPDKYHSGWYPLGDPTECAFSTLMLKAGFNIEEIETTYKRVQLFPFDSVRKRVSIIREYNGEYIAFIKGSIESVLEISKTTVVNGKIEPLTEDIKANLLDLSRKHASKAERIIALGYKDMSQGNSTVDETENVIVFAGFVTMIDPPNEQVKNALKTAFNAGLRVIMITGDNETTARAVANQIGMLNKDGSLPEVINDKKLQTLDDEEIKSYLNAGALIISRVSAEEKYKIISLLESKGDVVAVTGDGVNDTLGLKKADIGIAMGSNSSKVAQEAASMVLLDNNFSTIVLAIKEGRNIYNNIKKVVLADITNNFAELTCVLAGFFTAFWKLPPPIFAVHILLIDLVGNMLPLLMLTFDPAENELMNTPPRQKGEMLNKSSLLKVFYYGLLQGAIAFVIHHFSYIFHSGDKVQCEIAVTVTMISIMMCQFVNIFSSRTSKTIFTKYFISNIKLFVGIGISTTFMFILSYSPLMNKLLHTGPLSLIDWAFVLFGAAIYLLVFEIIKTVQHKKTIVNYGS